MIPTILFEDPDILVLSKPAGMIVNNADTTRDVLTLQDWVEDNITGFEVEDADSDFIKRSGIVHRLDKETSGVMIVAKNERTFSNLQKQFKEGGVSKTYIALAHGKVTPEEGEIKLPIGRLPWNRTRFGVFPQGRDSRTLYKVKEYKIWEHDKQSFSSNKQKEVLSLVEVYPKTGRTHQIRVHFQYLHHPLFADELYAGRKTSQLDRNYLARHFLHAAKISFTHPTSESRVDFESSLPEDLSSFLSTLQ